MKNILAALVVAFSATACATESVSTSGEDGVGTATDLEASGDELAAAAKSCGAKYKPAQQKYELAVATAKAMLARDVCGETTHPVNKSMVATNTTEDVEGLLVAAINECSYFRTVLNTSPFAKPARTVLAKSAMRGIIDGTVNPKTFAGLQAKLAGATIYGPKPGVVHTVVVSFLPGNRAVFSHPNFDTGTPDKTEYQYRVTPGSAPQIRFYNNDGELNYRIQHVKGSSEIKFISNGDTVLSSFSDPCSA